MHAFGKFDSEYNNTRTAILMRFRRIFHIPHMNAWLFSVDFRNSNVQLNTSFSI